MKVYFKVATLFLAFSFCLQAAICQAQESDPLNGYAIHVTYRDLTIMFYPMDGPKCQGAAGFTTPSSLVVKRTAKDSEHVSYIKVAAILQEGVWRVAVAVTFGESYDQEEKQIATYQIREGETARVKEIAQYGIRPFDVSIVMIQRAPAVQPAVVNRTASIAVLSVKTGALPMPYRIVLKNISDKEVEVLEIVTSNGKGAGKLKWPEGTWDRPLIGAGQKYEIEMPSEKEYQRLPASQYLSEQLQIIEINTVVFTDGTYEGNPELAVWQRAAAFGKRLQFDRVLSLIQSALEMVDTDSAFDQFKEAASSLDEKVEPAFIEDLKNQFPNLSENQKNSSLNLVRKGLHDVKSNLNGAIADFERGARQAVRGSFKDWLEKMKETYERWRSRLS